MSLGIPYMGSKKKSKKFADKNVGEWYQDLETVLSDLKEIDNFLK